MKERTRRSRADVLEALRQSRGSISDAARSLGYTRQHVHRYVNDHQLEEELAAIREEAIEYVEGRLWKLIEQGNVAATIFYLKCQARHRGWVERPPMEPQKAFEGTRIVILPVKEVPPGGQRALASGGGGEVIDATEG